MDQLNEFTQKMLKHEILTREEELELIEKINNGNEKERKEAREKLICCNLRLVVSSAGKYKGYASLPDLFEEGVIGLIRAVDKADIEIMRRKKSKFSTYAGTWINQKMRLFVAEQGITINRPIRIYNKAVGLKKEIGDSNGENSSNGDEEKFLLTLLEPLLSLNKKIPLRNGGNGFESIDLLKDEGWTGPEEEINHWAESEKIREIFEETRFLTAKEKNVIRLRFGFDGPAKTLNEIAIELGLSRERIRQIEKKAKNILRRILRPYANAL